MHQPPSDRFISDFPPQNFKKKLAKGTKELKSFHKTSPFDYEQSSPCSSSASSSSLSSQYARNSGVYLAGTANLDIISNQPLARSMSQSRSNCTFDEAQHKKILQLLTSDVKEMQWNCRQCSYANNALHVNICERCKSSRAVVSQNSKNKWISKQLQTDPQDMFQQSKGGDSSIEDQSWTCSNCTLINMSNSLSCEACCESKLQSLSLLDNTTSQKRECWSCPVCTLVNSSTVLECATCSTARIKSRSVDRSPNIKLTSSSSQAKSYCKQIKPKGKKGHQNRTVSTTTMKAETTKADNGQKTSNVVYTATNSNNGLSYHLDPWKCSLCAFENLRSEVICDMCKNMRNSIDDANPSMHLSQEEIDDLQWNYIVSECKLKKKMYVDEIFPTTNTSLYYSSTEQQYEKVKWLRLRDVTVDKIDEKLPWVVFRNLLEPSDVCQGDLGDCWLVSALSVLVERQDLMRAVVITKQLCPQGVYQVRLCKDGNWTVVTVDDLFPCDKYGYLLYSQAIRKQLWVPLIEKALAKLHGCYESLTCGSISEGLAILTGAPCENIPLQRSSASDKIDADFIWTKLISSRRALFLMGTVCGGINMTVDEAEIEKKGLHACHVYAILDVQCINRRRLLQLRDPYGEFGSSLKGWTAELQIKLLSSEPENGVFWIDFRDILKYFSCIGICKIRRGWVDTRLSGVLPQLSSVQELSSILLHVHEPTELELILYQSSQRETEQSKRRRLDLCIVLLKANGESSYRLVASSKRQIYGFVGCYKVLEPGKYIAIPITFNHWHLELAAESNLRYVLAVHSSNKLAATEVTSSAQAFADVIISLTMAKGECQKLLRNFTVYYLTKDFAGAAIVAENKYESEWVHLKCEGDNKECCNIVSTRGLKNTVDSIPPLHRQVVAVFTQFREHDKFFAAHQLDYRIADSSGLGDWGNKEDMLHIPEIDYESDRLHIPRLIVDD